MLMMHILDKDGLLKALGIKREHMLAFMNGVERIYLSEVNAYHNNMHATDVLQSMYALMGPWGLREQLSSLELFACYLAACVHDVGHPGARKSLAHAAAVNRSSASHHRRTCLVDV